ncbi:Hypothetical predicted protein [Octopus vulgaris]|uniref:Uncharacterized protein n=1 Tax=Octopus vulgaris TaxID=6645 RepID=A0AA36F285_OCTVU|nr:Hypothetical predicted protein [Octopus vulgaris]
MKAKMRVEEGRSKETKMWEEEGRRPVTDELFEPSVQAIRKNLTSQNTTLTDRKEEGETTPSLPLKQTSDDRRRILNIYHVLKIKGKYYIKQMNNIVSTNLLKNSCETFALKY